MDITHKIKNIENDIKEIFLAIKANSNCNLEYSNSQLTNQELAKLLFSFSEIKELITFKNY